MIRFPFFPGMRPLALASLATWALLGAAGCVHRIDIQQGNFLDQEDIARVSVGMTRVQVRALLGTPMVADPFHDARWDYVYYLKKGRWRKPEYRHFIVHFDAGDKVERIDWPTGEPTRSGPSAADEAVSGRGEPASSAKPQSRLSDGGSDEGRSAGPEQATGRESEPKGSGSAAGRGL